MNYSKEPITKSEKPAITVLKIISEAPLFLFLLPFFFLIHEYIAFHPLSSLKSLLSTTILFLGIGLLLTGFFYLLTKKLTKATVLSASTLLLNFSYGHLTDFFKAQNVNPIFLKYTVVIPFFIVLLFLLFLFLKQKEGLSRSIGFLNLLFSALIVFEISSFLLLKNKKIENQVDFLPLTEGQTKPDIYFIILDGYAGEEQTNGILSFDNSPFYDSLTRLGFRNIKGSKSNYNYTPYSTGSVLNMEYLNLPKAGNRRLGNTYALKKINESCFIRFLTKNGYKFNNHSFFKVNETKPPSNSAFLPSGSEIILSNTLISRFEKEAMLPIATKYRLKGYLKKKYMADKIYNDKVYKLTLEIAAKKEHKPKIVYTHLMMPHHPYYYDSARRLRGVEELANLPYGDIKAYLDYLKYTNEAVLTLLRSIVSSSKNPPIIALISDHGFRSFSGGTSEEAQRLPFCNIMSVLTPSKNYSKYSDSLSNINLFRVLLNAEFGQRLPMLKDSTSFISF